MSGCQAKLRRFFSENPGILKIKQRKILHFHLLPGLTGHVREQILCTAADNQNNL
jgi:hypothetical protein